jgi:sec-independent protein translocase protein TatC
MTKPMKVSSSNLSFYDHLEELRGVLLRVFIVIVVVSLAVYAFIDKFMAALIRSVDYLVFTAPADAFIARIILTLFVAFICVLPYVLFEIWNFVSYGLKKHERKYILIFGPLSFILFFIGALFSYLIVIPISIKFLLGFSSDLLIPMITIKSYISFVITMVLAFGVVFEMPLVLMFLTKIGVATPAFLIQKRKFAVVIMLIVSALITPPDVITQLMLAGPLMILYEIGILVSKLVYKKKEE